MPVWNGSNLSRRVDELEGPCAFEGTGGALSGSLDSRLGAAPLEGLTVTHDGFDATVSVDFQGKSYGAAIKGQVEDDSINGTIKVKLDIAPTINYTGTRAA